MRSTTRWTVRMTVALLAALALLPIPSTAQADEYPDEPEAAMEYYEADVADWAEGPVQWIMLEEEQDRWDQLSTTRDKEEFIAWFWDRRDPDLRDDENPFKQSFYQRVALSNMRYSGFPKGWKSDRGRIHVTLGKPGAVSPAFGANTEAVLWTYYTVGPQGANAPFGSVDGDIQIAFARSSGEIGYEIYGGFGGMGGMPLYVRDAIGFANKAYVVNPDLEPGVMMADDMGS